MSDLPLVDAESFETNPPPMLGGRFNTMYIWQISPDTIDFTPPSSGRWAALSYLEMRRADRRFRAGNHLQNTVGSILVATDVPESEQCAKVLPGAFCVF